MLRFIPPTLFAFIAGSVSTLFYLSRRAVVIPVDFAPGEWFGYYMDDWMEYHGVNDPDSVTSGVVQGAVTGNWIWVTNTPEWDRDWFVSHSSRFPELWVPYAALEDADGDPGSVVKLPGL